MNLTNDFECILLICEESGAPIGSEFIKIIELLGPDTKLIPIEVAAKECGACGFIAFKAADEKLNFRYGAGSDFYERVADILNRTQEPEPQDEYMPEGVRTMICTTLPV